MDFPSQSHPIRGRRGLAALRPLPLSRNSRHSGLICHNSPLLHRGRFLTALTLPGDQGWALSTWMGFLEDRNRLGKLHQGWESGNDSAPWWDWEKHKIWASRLVPSSPSLCISTSLLHHPASFPPGSAFPEDTLRLGVPGFVSAAGCCSDSDTGALPHPGVIDVTNSLSLVSQLLFNWGGKEQEKRRKKKDTENLWIQSAERGLVGIV